MIDLSGNDVYHGGAASDAEHPVSVVIDLFGDDRYESAGDQPAFGAGLLGYGVLVDAGGKRWLCKRRVLQPGVRVRGDRAARGRRGK